MFKATRNRLVDKRVLTVKGGGILVWIPRTLAPVEYRQFVRGEISDKALAEAVFDNGTCGSLRTVQQGRSHYYAQQIEVNLIVSSLVLHGSAVSTFNEDQFRESELYLHHAKIVDDDRADGDMPVEYSSVIVSRASKRESSLRAPADAASRKADYLRRSRIDFKL